MHARRNGVSDRRSWARWQRWAAAARSHLLRVGVVVDEASKHEARQHEEDHSEGVVLLVVRVLVLVPDQVYCRVGRRQEHHLQDRVVHLRRSGQPVSPPALSLLAANRPGASGHGGLLAHRCVLPQARAGRQLDEPHRDEVQVCAAPRQAPSAAYFCLSPQSCVRMSNKDAFWGPDMTVFFSAFTS